MTIFEEAIAVVFKCNNEMDKLLGMIDRRNQGASAILAKLCTAVTGKTIEPDTDQGTVISAISQAERTLMQHSGDPAKSGLKRKPRKETTCWGCGGNHPYWDNKKKKPRCPNAHKPEVRERAELARKEFRARRGDRRKKTRFDQGAISSIAQQTAAATVAAMKEVSSDSTRASGHTGQVIDLNKDSRSAGGISGVEINVTFALMNLSARAMLPVDVCLELPHI